MHVKDQEKMNSFYRRRSYIYLHDKSGTKVGYSSRRTFAVIIFTTFQTYDAWKVNVARI